jgi:hypothetical protein
MLRCVRTSCVACSNLHRENLVSEMHNSEALIHILGGTEPNARDTQAIQTAVAEVLIYATCVTT